MITKKRHSRMFRGCMIGCALLLCTLPNMPRASEAIGEALPSGDNLDSTVDAETATVDSTESTDSTDSTESNGDTDFVEEDADTASSPRQLLDLISAQRRALADNPSIAAGAERVNQVQQMVAQVRSMYYPQIDLSYTYSFTWLPKNYTDSVSDSLDQAERMLRDWRKESITQSTRTRQPSLRARRNMRSWYRSAQNQIATTRDYIDGPVENTTMSLTMGWLLFDGFAREYANAMARHGFSEAQAAFRDGQRILLDAVAQVYYGAQIAREQIAVSESNVAFNERLLTDAKAMREAGRGSTSHVLTFETLLYAGRANLLLAERDYEMALMGLALLLGIPETQIDEMFTLAPLEEETPETMTPPDPDAMIALAFAYRPDLEQSEKGLQRAQASVRREYAKFAPQIAAVGMLETANVNETGFSTDRITTTVGINASMNLFSGGRRRAETLEAKHARREAELQITAKEQEIVREVNQAVADLITAQKALALQRDAEESVQKNRDLTEMGYNAGKEMLVTLNQAQRDYVQASGMLAQARVNLQRSWQALHAATGVSLTVLTQDKKEDATVIMLEGDELAEE